MVLEDLVRFYQELTLERVALFSKFYSEDAYFKDPFNEVHGLASIQRIFTHMFHQVDEPAFKIHERLQDGKHVMLVWELHYRSGRSGARPKQVIRGASHLKLNAEGKVFFHRDYWDAAEELYLKLPLLGWLMRALRKKLAAIAS